jgi:hypothetical protein
MLRMILSIYAMGKRALRARAAACGHGAGTQAGGSSGSSGQARAGRRLSPRLWPGPQCQGSGTSSTRVPQFCCPVVVWLDLGGMYSVASQAAWAELSGTAKE